MPLRALTAVLLFCAVSGAAGAADLIGYSEAFDTLYRVDLTTQTATEIGRATPIGSSRLANIEGLTFSPAGKLYAVSDAGSIKTLLRIDPATGLASIIGTMDLGSAAQLDLGMAFTCDGRLWMSAATGQFWQVNPSTAQVTLVGNLGVTTITGLAARGDDLFGSGGHGDNNLYRIDPATAAITLVGSYGTSADITAASPMFDSAGHSWAILDYVPPLHGTTVADWSDLASIDDQTGTLTNLGAITASGPSVADLQGIGLRGLAIPSAVCAAAATAPSTPALSWPAVLACIVLLAALGGTRLRRERHRF